MRGWTFCKLAIVVHGGEIWAEDDEDSVGYKFISTQPLIRVA